MLHIKAWINYDIFQIQGMLEMSKRPNFNESKEKALANNPALKAEYEALAPMFEIKRKMIAMRKEKGRAQ